MMSPEIRRIEREQRDFARQVAEARRKMFGPIVKAMIEEQRRQWRAIRRGRR